MNYIRKRIRALDEEMQSEIIAIRLKYSAKKKILTDTCTHHWSDWRTDEMFPLTMGCNLRENRKCRVCALTQERIS